MDFYDIYSQKFYLFSLKRRTLIDFSSEDHNFAYEVEKAFANIRAVEGGNVHALYCYKKQMLEEMQSLSEKYKKQYPNVQQLPAFFKGLEEGDYFIRQRANVSLIDLKRSILEIDSRALGLDVRKADSIFMLKWGRLYQTYDTFSYGFLSDKIFVGEKEKSKRVCRFCKNTDAKYYKNISHALQEGLGNHLLFAYEECDKCNSLFSNSVEKPLFLFLEINRNLSQVRGKHTTIHNQEGLNFQIHPDPITKEPVVYVMQEYIFNDEYQGKLTGKIYLYNKGPVIYQGVYKALVKFAVDMIPSERMSHFIRTGEWVHGDFMGADLPAFWYGEQSTFFFEQPIIDLFFRSEKSPSISPYCTAVLYIYDCVFIYILPYCDIDNEKKLKPEDINRHFEYFKKNEYIYVQEWVEYDSNDLEGHVAYYKIPIIGIAGKYRVVYRPSSDPIFQIRRENEKKLS